MSSNFALLEKHLENDQRRRELLAIESRLEEHAYPPQLVVENTSICNLTCIHCSHRELQRVKRHMKRELWNKIVEEFGAHSPNTEIWPTFYGEALIMGYKGELWDRLDYAAKVGCQNLVLNSNGVLLNRWDNIEKILSSPLRRFILSLDGLSPETFELVREKAKWHEVYPAVEELCRRRMERKQKYPVIVAQFSVMKQNAHEVDAYRAYWEARGAEVKIDRCSSGPPPVQFVPTPSCITPNSVSRAPGATIRWRFTRTARWLPARSIMQARSTSAMSRTSP